MSDPALSPATPPSPGPLVQLPKWVADLSPEKQAELAACLREIVAKLQKGGPMDLLAKFAQEELVAVKADAVEFEKRVDSFLTYFGTKFAPWLSGELETIKKNQVVLSAAATANPKP